jgi:hypothetical protein
MPRDSTATVDGIEETATDKGGFCYNAGTDGYEYDWGTSSTWSGCGQVVVKLKDGTVHQANYIFRQNLRRRAGASHLGSSSCPYSPDCVEVEFSEVRL